MSAKRGACWRWRIASRRPDGVTPFRGQSNRNIMKMSQGIVGDTEMKRSTGKIERQKIIKETLNFS